MFAKSLLENAIHSSRNKEIAEQELHVLFGETPLNDEGARSCRTFCFPLCFPTLGSDENLNAFGHFVILRLLLCVLTTGNQSQREDLLFSCHCCVQPC